MQMRAQTIAGNQGLSLADKMINKAGDYGQLSAWINESSHKARPTEASDLSLENQSG